MTNTTFTLEELECIAQVFRISFGASNHPLCLMERELSQKIHGILIESKKNSPNPPLERREWIINLHHKMAQADYKEWIDRMNRMLEYEDCRNSKGSEWIEEIHKKCAQEAYDQWIYRMYSMLEKEGSQEP